MGKALTRERVGSCGRSTCQRALSRCMIGWAFPRQGMIDGPIFPGSRRLVRRNVMAPDSPRVTLTLPTDLRMLSVARAFVEAVCQAHGLDKTSTHAFVLATAEAVSNIIRHAHRYRPEAQFQIECRFSSDIFEVAFLDEGDPFDISTVPQLDPTELRVGGRGVYL